MADGGTLSTAQLEQILRTLVAEIRKPPVDPVKEAQKAREQKTKIEACCGNEIPQA